MQGHDLFTPLIIKTITIFRTITCIAEFTCKLHSIYNITAIAQGIVSSETSENYKVSTKQTMW